MTDSSAPRLCRDQGILYVAIGESMREPLARSIQSAHKLLDLPITVVTNLADVEDADEIVFVTWPGNSGYAVKPAFIPRLPYTRTMFLDTDTVIKRSDAASPLRLLTDNYGYHAAAIHGLSRRFQHVDVLPCTPSCNSGVLFLRHSPVVQQAMQLWQALYPGYGADETYLTRALLQSKVPTYWLPCEWNYRGAGLGKQHHVRIEHLSRTKEATQL
ncbi:hypothetical protein [Novipirellula artificiosorum]|uniref:Nucleotide-diphospho-sugar transferase n=1 Tax=Novipirellula artificiosorum TaxID=2528016 RepID=A0A5C6DR40_9BACT|nr:hypothetical protein [Novipirellula artificiosorum]TWU39310.1 hypothetical protein Poly41_21340 [Novipirellula artificiosorum]